jgi:hypothetical protein
MAACLFAAGRETCTAEFRPPDEKAAWALWKRHLAQPKAHEDIVEACRKFIVGRPEDPYVVVARGIMAWHLLKAERIEEATEILTLLGQSPNTSETRMEAIRRSRSEKLHEFGMEMARRWLARIDRESLCDVLRKYYAKKVQYPRKLSELEGYADGKKLPMRDRWNRTWSYRVSSYESVKNTYGQKYRLVSPTLGDASALGGTLEIPYASRIDLKPVKLFSTGGKRQMIEFRSPEKEGSIFLRVGTQIEGVFFAYEGERLIVLSDGDHWCVLPKPRQ